MTLIKTTRPAHLSSRPAFGAFAQLQDELDRLFGAAGAPFGTQFFNVWAPALDVYEDKENLVVKLEVPGMKKEDFNIALHEGVLSVSGEPRFEDRREKASGYRSERFEGRFHRSIALPKVVDATRVRAAYKDGILSITLPVAEEARPKQIVVSTE
ncbi:MAG: Hsp20/alpha crystallin family protein [Planctomycetes bacterium]|nr:Hsp20/alpha crystallin family protein [Planctomycetota bacterium]